MSNYINKNSVKYILLLIGVVIVVLFIIYISNLNDYPTSRLRDILEIMYFVTSSFLLIVGGVGLKQLGIAKENSKLTATRESYKLAAEQCTHFLNYILPQEGEIFLLLKSKSLEHLGDVEIIVKDNKISFNSKLNEKNYNLLTNEMMLKILNLLNALEAYSVFFTQRVADDKVAFSTIGYTYCSIVRRFLPVILIVSNNGEKGFSNTIELYSAWSLRMDQQKVLREKLEAENKLKQCMTVDYKSLGT